MSIRAALLVATSVTLAACGGSSHGRNPAKVGTIELDLIGEWTDPLADHPAPPAFAVGDRSAALVNPRAPLIAITGGTVMTATGKRFDPGLVLLEGGRILFAGDANGREIPSGARVIAARGKTVTPGIIDAHSHLGVYPSPAVNALEDGNEMTAPVTAQVRAEYAYWPQDPAITRARAGGVTTALILPGSANLIGGRGFTVIMRPGTSIEDARFPGAPPTLKMACGENPKGVYGEKGGPQTRMGMYAAFRAAFQQAVEYRAKWRAYERARSTWEKRRARARELEEAAAKAGRPGRVKPEPAPDLPARDLGLETLAGVLSGDVLPQVHCYRAQDMTEMLRIADRFGFRIRAFHHAIDAYKIREELVARKIAVATWADWWGFKMEALDGIRENAGMVSEAGGRAVIHSDSSIGIQRLNQEAAKAMYAARAAGIAISEDEALRWITANPAWVLGIDDVVGTLEKGKRADVVVWSGNPFSVYSRAEVVIQGGEVTYELARGLPETDFEVANSSLDAWRTGAAPVMQSAPPATARPAASCGNSGAGAAAPAPIDGTSFAIRGATIYVEPGKVVRGTIVVRDGVVSAVGAGASVQGLPVIDGTGKVVTAGLIDASTRLGLVEVAQEESTVDGSFDPKGPIRAAYRVIDGYDPRSIAIPVARAGGVTSAVTAPEGGLVSGSSGWMSLAEGGRAEKLAIAEPLAMVASLGADGRRASGGSRGVAALGLRELLDDAVQYARRRQSYERNQTRRFAASRLDLEALVPVVRRQRPLVVRADRATDIRAALRLARDFRLRLVIEGGAEAWMVADELAAARVPVVMNPFINLPFSFDHVHVRGDAAAILAQAGVEVALSTLGSATSVRNLRQLAGNAVANGLPWDRALAAITSVPARIYANARRGTLARGQVADLVLWTGDPLELSSRAERVFIGGAEQPVKTRQDLLRERYRRRPGRPARPARQAQPEASGTY